MMLAALLVVQLVEILEIYVEALKSIDHRGKLIIACVIGKEFALADVIKMEKASIPVFSTHRNRVADTLAIMYWHQKRMKEKGARE